MKTRHTAAASTARIHALMAIAGIMIAIICSLILLKDNTGSQRAETVKTDIIETSKSVITNQIVKVKEVSILAVISFLK